MPLHAQGLSPTTPAKEYVYFNGQLVAIEESGTGGLTGAVKVIPPSVAEVTSSSPSDPVPTPPAGLSLAKPGAPPETQPSLPKPNTPPQDTSASAAKLTAVTLPETHVANPPRN